MDFNFLKFLSASLVLFSVIDILGSIPVVISIKEKGRKVHSRNATIISGILMITFLFVGESILKLLNVDITSFAIAGGIIIFLIGIEMILGITIFKDEVGASDSTVVPIAFPLIAGAGTLTTILSLKSEYDNIVIIAAIILNMVVIYIVLKSSEYIGRKLGIGGMSVLRKVFGIILLAISIKLITGNFTSLIDPSTILPID